MAPKAPSEGQKVDLGQNAPIKNEPAGSVPSGSLAAESSAFSSNVGIHGENQPSGNVATTLGSASNTTERSAANDTTSGNAASYDQATGKGDFAQTAKSNAGAAPTYIAPQYASESGPHGKNITEGFDDAGTRDGLKAALAAEPGSKDDPSRRAELQFQETNEQRTTAAQPKDGGVSNQTKYDALNRETSS